MTKPRRRIPVIGEATIPIEAVKVDPNKVVLSQDELRRPKKEFANDEERDQYFNSLREELQQVQAASENRPDYAFELAEQLRPICRKYRDEHPGMTPNDLRACLVSLGGRV